VGEGGGIRAEPGQGRPRSLHHCQRAGSEGEIKGITVPESTWKIIVALESGKSWPDGQQQAQVFAILMPNHEGIKNDRWQQFQTNVSEIEKKTGYHFFVNAPVIHSIAKAAGH